MFKRILVAVDDSETSEHALRQAIDLARTPGSSLLILHVVEEIVLNVGEEIVDPRALWQALATGGRVLLERHAQQVHNAGVDATTRLIELRDMGKSVAESIIEAAKDWHADLIVLGTHGRRGWRRLLLGSTAEEVTRLATVPVLLIRTP